MTEIPTTCVQAEALETAAGLVREIHERTGVTVGFYLPDGPLPPEPIARLVREAAATQQDRVEVVGNRLLAAWPLHLRAQPTLVAAAELDVADEASRRMGRGLLAAVAEAVRARMAESAVRVEGDSLAEALSQSFEEVCLLHNLGEILRVNHPVTELLEYMCAELRATTGAEATVAYLPPVDGGAPETVVVGQLPMPVSDLTRLIAHVLDGLEPQECVLINNHCQDDPVLMGLSMALERLVLVSLPLTEGVRGVMMAINRRSEEFGSPDAKLIRSTANSSAVFIENRRLYNELQQLMLDLVRALVSSVDAKDPYTCGHSSRVAITAREIARQMCMPADEVEQAYLAGLLHDIGKIGTPEAILRKEGLLLPEEREIICQHPGVGGRILSGIRKLETIRGAVVHHHERIDGQGYPDKLPGDAIPLLARIVGLADAFDAMTSNRPYRPMRPLPDVIREVERNIGTQFDARVAKAFFSLNVNRLMQLFVDEAAAGPRPQPMRG